MSSLEGGDCLLPFFISPVLNKYSLTKRLSDLSRATQSPCVRIRTQGQVFLTSRFRLSGHSKVPLVYLDIHYMYSLLSCYFMYACIYLCSKDGLLSQSQFCPLRILGTTLRKIWMSLLYCYCVNPTHCQWFTTVMYQWDTSTNTK